MSDLELCLDFVKEFYSITVRKSYGESVIILHDCLETKETNNLHYIGTVMGTDVYFIWDKAKIVTGINLDLKSNSEILPTITSKFKNIQTFSFIKYLLESIDKRDKGVVIDLIEVKEEFPALYEGVFENGIYY
jgi:hypothetical protein